MQEIKEYEINTNTMALVYEPYDKTVIYEFDREYLINTLPTKLMENSCTYFGSSLLGRQQGTAKLTGITHKAPIIMEETKEMIYFPTSSPRLKECSWINLKSIKKYEIIGNDLFVYLLNNKKLILDLSYGIFDNQVLRATRLESVLRNHKENSQK